MAEKKYRYRDASGAYQFLRIETEETKHGKYKKAVCLNHKTGKETSFNDVIFKDIPAGAHVTFNHNLPYPKGVVIITEDQIPVILADDERVYQEMLAEARRIKEANIATGRFKYYYTDFRDSKAENIEEFLSNKREEFEQCLVDEVNSGSRTSGREREVKLTVEQLDGRYTDFLKHYQEGDELVWYSWNGGVLAYSAGPALRRGDQLIACMPWIVS